MVTIFFKPWLWLYRRAGHQLQKVIQLPLELIRRILTKLGDPTYTTTIRGHRLAIPVSHSLPLTIAAHPLYDTLPARIAEYLRTRDGAVTMVDIGANVGDTILACADPAQRDRFLAIEPTPRFARLLKRNTAHLPDVTLLEVYCHSGGDDHARVRIETAQGTARVIESDDGATIPRRTLDDIIGQHPEFAALNFLKVDTDGSDFEVITGARATIGARRPMVLIECQAFGNARYAEDVVDTVGWFGTAGYDQVIVYDRYGHWFGSFPTSDGRALLPAIAFQMISDMGNFDLLFLGPTESAFARTEKEFFAAEVERRGSAVSPRRALGIE